MTKELLQISQDLDRVVDALSDSVIPEPRLVNYALHRISKDLDEYLVDKGLA